MGRLCSIEFGLNLNCSLFCQRGRSERGWIKNRSNGRPCITVTSLSLCCPVFSDRDIDDSEWIISRNRARLNSHSKLENGILGKYKMVDSDHIVQQKK